jgi:type IV pilus assembly protein PilV
MNIFRAKNSRGGFTLLEVLIAITLMAISLLALAAMQGVAINANAVAYRHTVQSMLTQQTIEDISSYAYDDGVFTSPVVLSNMTYSMPGLLDPGVATSSLQIASAGTYSASYQVEPPSTFMISGLTQTTLARITVRMTFNPGSANQKQISYSTLRLVK